MAVVEGAAAAGRRGRRRARRCRETSARRTPPARPAAAGSRKKGEWGGVEVGDERSRYVGTRLIVGCTSEGIVNVRLMRQEIRQT